MSQNSDRTIKEVYDATPAGVSLVAWAADIMPVLVGGCAVIFYLLKLVNWYRTNFLGCESWKGL